MKALIFSFAANEKRIMAQVEIKNGQLVINGPAAFSIREELENGIFNIAERKKERVYPNNPELLIKNLPYFYHGSLVWAELIA